MFRNIYIFGLGMMGGSLAHAIKRGKNCKKVYAYDTCRQSLLFAKKNLLIDDYDDKQFTLLKKSDLIIICAPVKKYDEIFNVIDKNISENVIVSDIGSIKSNITKSLDNFPVHLRRRFIGSHPLTGSEKYGIRSFQKNLYNNQYVLISQFNRDTNLLKKITNFWRKIGCNCITINPKQHDSLLALTSHLPHIASFVLVKNILSKCPSEEIDSYTGGGFRDFARLANSDPEMWEGIISLNKRNIIKSIDEFTNEIENLKKIIRNGKSVDIKKYIEKIHKKLN